MQYLHIKNLEKYHLNYQDRQLTWCKTYFSMINSDPEFEMLEEIDKWRFICFVMLELQIKKEIPLSNDYLTRKGFDLKKRPISKTLQMLHTLIEVRDTNGTHIILYKEDYIKKNKSVVTDKPVTKTNYADFVKLTKEEHEALESKYGVNRVIDYIERLNNYIGSTGKGYKSHYHTILNWASKDIVKTNQPRQPKADPNCAACKGTGKLNKAECWCVN